MLIYSYMCVHIDVNGYTHVDIVYSQRWPQYFKYDETNKGQEKKKKNTFWTSLLILQTAH